MSSKTLQEAELKNERATEEAEKWQKLLAANFAKLISTEYWFEALELIPEMQNDLEQWAGLIEIVEDSHKRICLLEQCQDLSEHSPKIPSDEWTVHG